MHPPCNRTEYRIPSGSVDTDVAEISHIQAGAHTGLGPASRWVRPQGIVLRSAAASGKQANGNTGNRWAKQMVNEIHRVSPKKATLSLIYALRALNVY